MTMMTPIEGITAPAIPARAAAPAPLADILPAAPSTPRGDDGGADTLTGHPLDRPDLTEEFARVAAADGPVFARATRADGWTPDRQRGFLDYVAQGCTVADAATMVGMSAASAYAFRKRAAGAAFAVGWSGALLLQRNRLADDLMGRALKGNVDYAVNPKGERVERHRHDNRLALALLTRLDRIAAADVPDRTGDARAARLAAQDWDRYLDLIGGDASPAQAGLFLSLRTTEGESAAIAPIVALARADLYRRTGASHAGEVHVHDLDPAHRHDWSAADWARAEAGGLVSLAAPAKEEAHTSQLSQLRKDRDYGVWWSEYADDWRTAFPPPAGFDGVEDGTYGNGGYSRALSDDEYYAVETWNARELEAKRVPEEAERVAFFAELLAGDVGAEAPDNPCSGEDRSAGERKPDAATAPACAGARVEVESEDGPLPVRAEQAGHSSKYHFDGTLAEAPYFVPQAVESQEEGRPFDERRANGCGAGAVRPNGPGAGMNPASSDGALAPPAGAGTELRVRSFATA